MSGLARWVALRAGAAVASAFLCVGGLVLYLDGTWKHSAAEIGGSFACLLTFVGLSVAVGRARLFNGSWVGGERHP